MQATETGTIMSLCRAFILYGGPCAHGGTVVAQNTTFATEPLIMVG